jgi:hypothetical protein
VSAEQARERNPEHLAADVPQRDVDRGEREGDDAARPARRRGRPQLGADRLVAQRIVALDQRAEILDRGMNRRW